MTSTVFRVHPAIGFARVGNSEDYYLAPETIAGMPTGRPDGLTGGLPIRKWTEDDPIRSSDLRDAQGSLKRQAARFRIFAYDNDAVWPHGGGTEVTIGSEIGGKRVKDIVWSVHLANKKANCFMLETTETVTDYLSTDPDDPNVTEAGGVTVTTTPETETVSFSQSYTGQIIDNYMGGQTPPLRNPQFGKSVDSPRRVRTLTIDPGPRTVQGRNAETVAFDRPTRAAWVEPDGRILDLPTYPKLFPEDHLTFAKGTLPISTLGGLTTDDKGRLLVLPGYGRAVPWVDPATKAPYPLNFDVDNDGWFDDTADGPVVATVVFEDGSAVSAVHGWVNCTDPGYAPQILNVVSLWDDVYDTWVRKLDLRPDLFDGSGYVPDYRPGFADDIKPIFRAANLMQWATNLPPIAKRGHDAVDAITAEDNPAKTILAGLRLIRNPNNPGEDSVGAPLMPLSLGDSGSAFMTVTQTQYFCLERWNEGAFDAGSALRLGPGEELDRASLYNCLGGRFSPGIDMTFIVRQTDLYVEQWRELGVGPFRIARKPIDYAEAAKGQSVLTGGYVPLQSGAYAVEPGDCSKFMALPWHTDYNSCATHPTSPSVPAAPGVNSTTLYWSWPAQRPVAVYVASEVGPDGSLGRNRYSVRGPGTESTDPADQGRFQNRLDIISSWWKIGVVMQGPAIDGGNFPPDRYLEVASRFADDGVPPWPINAASAADAA